MTARSLIGLSLLLGVALAPPASSSVQVRLSPFIGDGMVVQRGARVPISGSGAPTDLYVQPANYMPGDAEPPAPTGWTLPRIAQAVIIELGGRGEHPPRDKQDAEARLALAARKVAYGEDLVYSGPADRRQPANDERVRSDLDHLGQAGLPVAPFRTDSW